ncbi:ClpP/crotonase-like domain-containing protein [Hyaloraphidium curvatum]|nr:ClpP/crotonase-like domain-containing protein [Hyaloraphidium curvatum]
MSQPLVTVTPDTENPHVMILRFNNPSALNSLSVPMGFAFGEAIDKCMDEMEDVRAIVLTGEGRAFCAGADLRVSGTRQTLAGNPNKVYEGSDFYNLYLGPIRRCKVPIIAAINGPAIGAGFSVALACDLRVAAKGAKVGVNFVRLGLHPGMAATQTIPLITNHQHANLLLLTGQTQNAEHPVMAPLFAQVVDGKDLMPTALGIARQIAEAAPLAVRMTTRTMRLRFEENIDVILEREGVGQKMCRVAAPDQLAEGTKAAFEKRTPKFNPSTKL